MLDRIGWGYAGIAGIDGRGLTIRELAWAADGRQEAEWYRAAVFGSIGTDVDPVKLIPPRYRPKPSRLPPRDETAAGFQALGAALSRMAGG